MRTLELPKMVFICQDAYPKKSVKSVSSELLANESEECRENSKTDTSKNDLKSALGKTNLLCI